MSTSTFQRLARGCGITDTHERFLAAPLDECAPLIDQLASDHDVLWAHRDWPAMRFAPGLEVGGPGGHGPIRYYVEEHDPGRWVRFRFTGQTESKATTRLAPSAGSQRAVKRLSGVGVCQVVHAMSLSRPVYPPAHYDGDFGLYRVDVGPRAGDPETGRAQFFIDHDSYSA